MARIMGIVPGVDEHWLRVDISHRLWRIRERVESVLRPGAMADPVLGPRLLAYVAGLEAGRAFWNAQPGARNALAGATSGAAFPADQIARLLGEPFRVDDVLAFSLVWPGFGARDAINRLAGQASLGTGQGFTASNGWMLNAAASATGHPMLLSDPHLPADVPFYQGAFATLHGGAFEVAGWFFPGLPFPSLGATREVAWTATANGVDHHDVWTAVTDTPSSYSVGGVVHPIVRTRTFISYRDRQTNQRGARAVDLSWADGARDLPILEESLQAPGGPFYSTILFAGATFVTASSSLVSFLGRLCDSGTIADAQAAVDLLALPDQNLLVLHRTGAMAYWSMARLPLRPTNAPGLPALQGLLNGNDPATRWLSGVYPATSLPAEALPAGAPGEVWINNNDTPELTRPPGSSTLSPNTFPLGMSVAPPHSTWRQQRARQLLVQPVTRAQFDAAALDQHDPWTPALVPYFQQAIAQASLAGIVPYDPVRDALVASLGAWSGACHAHSNEAAFAYLLRAKYEGLLLEYQSQGGAAAWPVDARLVGPYDNLPALSTFSPNSHLADMVAMAFATQFAVDHLYGAVLASAPSGTFVPPAWTTPTPWSPTVSTSPYASFGPLLELGHLKFLDLTPPASPPGMGAIFPLGGAKDSLFQTGTLDLASTLTETFSGNTLTAATVSNRLINGSTPLMIVEFLPSGPSISYVTPVGNTEILADARRYLRADAFAGRQLRPLYFDATDFTNPANVYRLTTLVMP